eukprot:COSAG02_NODE_21078_length_803_cov_1.524148_1_plen_151_part_00
MTADILQELIDNDDIMIDVATTSRNAKLLMQRTRDIVSALETTIEGQKHQIDDLMKKQQGTNINGSCDALVQQEQEQGPVLEEEHLGPEDQAADEYDERSAESIIVLMKKRLRSDSDQNGAEEGVPPEQQGGEDGAEVAVGTDIDDQAAI